MASIKDLKKRITSTKNTQQTTKAMKMVSAAKLRRATDAILSQRPYAQEIASLMSALSDEGSNDSLTNRKPVSLLVAFSSDRGLCGGYNSTVIKAASLFGSEGSPLKGRKPFRKNTRPIIPRKEKNTRDDFIFMSVRNLSKSNLPKGRSNCSISKNY